MKHISEYLAESLKEMFEERAAIREFCGKQPRKDAEEEARVEVEKMVARKVDNEQETDAGRGSKQRLSLHQ